MIATSILMAIFVFLRVYIVLSCNNLKKNAWGWFEIFYLIWYIVVKIESGG